MSLKRTFQIEPLNDQLVAELQHKIDQKTKPLGALGRLERLALRIGRIQNSLTPALNNPTVLIFAADHGVTEEGVSAYPKEVTQQMVLNFLAGGAACTVFARQHHMDFYVIDSGVDGELPKHEQLIERKIAPGTRNFRRESAMTAEQCEEAIAYGAEIVHQIAEKGCNVITFGEMGIGNTSSASVILSLLGNIPLDICIGRGSGLDDPGLANKKRVLEDAISFHTIEPEPFNVLATFGGLEIAMMCGAFLQAAEEKMVIMVDGFIATSALIVASKLYPAVLEYCIFGHVSEEPGHQKMLELLNAEPLLNMNMRLGEATGAVVAYPIVESAVAFLNEMASFESAGVSSGS